MPYSGTLRRILAAVILALFVAQTAGLSLAASVTCVQTCEDDGPDGQCAPSCADCVCCAHSRYTAALPASAPILANVNASRSWPSDTPPADSDPQDIMHVPKRSLRRS